MLWAELILFRTIFMSRKYENYNPISTEGGELLDHFS